MCFVPVPLVICVCLNITTNIYIYIILGLYDIQQGKCACEGNALDDLQRQHQKFSTLSNQRTDEHGRTFAMTSNC